MASIAVRNALGDPVLTHTCVRVLIQGSVKEGRSRRGGSEEEDELHVLITGEKEEDVACAEKIISDLLVPQEDDNANEWKMAQLRELALINGGCAVAGLTLVWCAAAERAERAVALLANVHDCGRFWWQTHRVLAI